MIVISNFITDSVRIKLLDIVFRSTIVKIDTLLKMSRMIKIHEFTTVCDQIELTGTLTDAFVAKNEL